MAKKEKKIRLTIMIGEEKLKRLRNLQASMIANDSENHSLSSVLSKCIRIPKVSKK